MDGVALFGVCQAVARALLCGIQSQRPLAFRGAVSVGHLFVEPPFLVGPAVDEAAELCEKAEGAFVVLTERALATRVTFQPGHRPWDKVAVPYNAQLKCRELQTRVLNPFYELEQVDARHGASSMLATMPQDHEAIALKRENTARFLAHVGLGKGGS
jgi:hypothetical protein